MACQDITDEAGTIGGKSLRSIKRFELAAPLAETRFCALYKPFMLKLSIINWLNMPIAYTQGGSAEFRCQFRASRFRFPCSSPCWPARSNRIQDTDFNAYFCRREGLFGSKTRFVPARQGQMTLAGSQRGSASRHARAAASSDRLGIDAVGTVEIRRRRRIVQSGRRPAGRSGCRATAPSHDRVAG